MKKILFTSLAVLGLGITGCSNEDLGVAKSGVDEVCATMGDAESRTAMNGNSVVWSIGDEIGIFVTNGCTVSEVHGLLSVLTNPCGTCMNCCIKNLNVPKWNCGNAWMPCFVWEQLS
jgi:hypothetical protein